MDPVVGTQMRQHACFQFHRFTGNAEPREPLARDTDDAVFHPGFDRSVKGSSRASNCSGRMPRRTAPAKRLLPETARPEAARQDRHRCAAQQ